MNRNLYFFYEATFAAMAPARAMADASRLFFKNPANPLSHTMMGRTMAASAEMFERATRRYGKPAFDLPTTVVDGREVAVMERVVWSRPFCNLLHFDRAVDPGMAPQPKVLIVAPMSGHYATLLRARWRRSCRPMRSTSPTGSTPGSCRTPRAAST